MSSQPAFDTFFSYNSTDRKAVEEIALELKKQGVSVFLDRWYLTPGQNWHTELTQTITSSQSCVVFIGYQGMGPWQHREVGLAFEQQDQHPDYPLIPVLLPGSDVPLGFLKLNTWVDFRNGIDDELAIKTLLSAIHKQPPGPEIIESIQAIKASICPYKGLSYFREEDAAFFFGREVFTKRLFDKMLANNLVAVVGPSGSGKSSVVRAGLIPLVRQSNQEATWEIITMVPGNRPSSFPGSLYNAAA